MEIANKLLLSELNEQVKDVLLDAFPEMVWVIAEISELKENRNGHCYLEFIEKNEEDEITARARATIWSYTFRMLKPYFETTTGQPFAAGLKVLVQVTVEFHEVFGLSLNIKDIDPTYTLGDLVRRRNEIISKLKEDGIFDMNKELPLPEVPQRIAVISSATAAGYQDFVNQVENNSQGFVFCYKLFEAYMQGAGAATSIIDALERIFNYLDFFDVVIIIRGGGAQADLTCFDNYELAANVAQFPLPVLTGIGHEKDETITDMVAHTRLKTPTAVAEFLISGASRFYEKLQFLDRAITDRVKEILDRELYNLNKVSAGIASAGQYYILIKRNSLSTLMRRFKSATNENSNFEKQKLSHYIYKVQNDFTININDTRNRLRQTMHDLKKQVDFVFSDREKSLAFRGNNFKNSVYKLIQDKGNEIRFIEKTADLLNPENVLTRGYTLTYKSGKIQKRRKGLKKDDVLTTRFADGKIKSRIEK